MFTKFLHNCLLAWVTLWATSICSQTASALLPKVCFEPLHLPLEPSWPSSVLLQCLLRAAVYIVYSLACPPEASWGIF